MKVFCISIKSKFTLALFFCALVLLLLILDVQNSVSSVSYKAVTNEDRVALIGVLGYKVLPEVAEQKTIVIPDKFNDVYTQYNLLQQKSGFDLKLYKGLEVSVFKYKIENDDRFVNIILHDGLLIGGDVSSSNLNGKMESLK